MQTKRKKRSRIRAAKPTAGHGSKKKNRGAGHRGGRGKSGQGKRGDAKLMKVTYGKIYLGKTGFKSLSKNRKTINLQTLQSKLSSWEKQGKIKKENGQYVVDLTALGYDKLLSKGLLKEKVIIKVKEASRKAIDKIKDSDCKIEVLNNNKD